MTTLFGIDIHEAVMPNYNEFAQEAIGKILPLFENPDEREHESQRGGAKSVYYKYKFRLHENIDISPITDFILEQAKIYWNHLKYSKNLTPQILNTWANLTPPGGHWDSHFHSPAPIAGAFYLDAPPGVGNLVLEHPLETLLACQPFEFDLEPRHYDHVVNVFSGKLVLFPGWLRHRTQVNTSSENRLILGVNIGCQGSVSYLHLI